MSPHGDLLGHDDKYEEGLEDDRGEAKKRSNSRSHRLQSKIILTLRKLTQLVHCERMNVRFEQDLSE